MSGDGKVVVLADWLAMRRQDFDPTVPLTLFDPPPAERRRKPRPAPDGTLDLFATTEG